MVRIVLTVVGALLIVISLGLGAVGGVVTWAYATQRDAEGFFTTDTEHFETLTYAITSENLDLGGRPGVGDRRFDLGDLATVRFACRGTERCARLRRHRSRNATSTATSPTSRTQRSTTSTCDPSA